MKLFNDNFEDVDDDDASKHDYEVNNFFIMPHCFAYKRQLILELNSFITKWVANIFENFAPPQKQILTQKSFWACIWFF